jgi:hypothetical protein
LAKTLEADQQIPHDSRLLTIHILFGAKRSMSRHIAVAVLHGMGTEEEHFSVELKHRVTETYLALNRQHQEDDLVWHEIYWGDLVRDKHMQILQAVNYRNDLAYPNLREWIIDYMSTALLYREGTPLFQQIHARVRAQLTRFAHHRRIDADNTPLVLLAHSFGSVIAQYHLQLPIMGDSSKLTPFEKLETLLGFITFGSPLAIWAAQNGGAVAPISAKRLSPVLQQKARWINFYDKDDIIAYPLKALSDDYQRAVNEEWEINVGSARTSWNPSCHNGYWEDPDFYKPVAKYLAEIASVLT